MEQLSLLDLFPQQMNVQEYDIQTLPEKEAALNKIMMAYREIR